MSFRKGDWIQITKAARHNYEHADGEITGEVLHSTPTAAKIKFKGVKIPVWVEQAHLEPRK